MVKLPSFDDLKKAGADLVDSAKKGTLVDTLKTHVENLGANIAKPDVEVSNVAAVDDPIQIQVKAAYATVAEITPPEVAAKMRAQVTHLVNIIEAKTGKKYDAS